MAEETARTVETVREPEVNARNEDLDGGREILLSGHTGHNPGYDSYRVVGLERSVDECCEFVAGSLI